LPGKLFWDITITQVNSALHVSGDAKSSTSFGWGKGGWQVTECDPILHVITRSGVVVSALSVLLTYFNVQPFIYLSIQPSVKMADSLVN